VSLLRYTAEKESDTEVLYGDVAIRPMHWPQCPQTTHNRKTRYFTKSNALEIGKELINKK